ncbi:MAG: methionyl-tRNA formyltransferase [Actinomycetota bacterium]
MTEPATGPDDSTTDPLDSPLAAPPASISRLAFLGTPDVAAVSLRALVAAGFDVPLVVSRPDRRRGRGSTLTPSPVKAAALDLGLTVTDDLTDLAGSSVDLGVVVAYGRIIPVSLLQRIPMVNIHFSLLPRWRGAAPVERAILAGDDRTGVCLMAVAEGLDEGGVYAVETTDIDPDESAAALRGRLADIGAELLVRTLQNGLGSAEPQVGEATYAAKIDRVESRLDFTRPAIELHRVVRVGRAWAEFRDKRLGIEATAVVDGGPPQTDGGLPGEVHHRPGDAPLVKTAEGLLALEMVKPEGKRAMAGGDWANGVQPTPGERLG